MKAVLALSLLAISASAPAAAQMAEEAAAKPQVVLTESRDSANKVQVPAPPAGLGQVVFFRTGGQGFALGCQVVENGERVSALGAGDYFLYQAPPGPRTFKVSSEATDTLNLELEPDETQYVRCKIQMGIMVGRPNISPSTKEEFDKNSHKLELVDADDVGPKTVAAAAK